MQSLLKRLNALECAVGPTEQTVLVFLKDTEDDAQALVERWKRGAIVEEIQSCQSYRGGEIGLIVFRPVSPHPQKP